MRSFIAAAIILLLGATGACAQAGCGQAPIPCPAPGAQISGSFTPGDIIIGGPGTNQIQDGGFTPVKTYVGSTDPGASNDGSVGQGYVPGSVGVNTTSGRSFTMQSNATGAAVWNLNTPSIPIPWSAGTFAAGSTSFDAPGQGSNSTQNFAALAPNSGVLSNMAFRVAGAPGFTIAAAGSGGTAGSAVYSVGGGTCTVQPTINVTVTTGISSINSIAGPPAACTVYPPSPAPLTYVSGTGTGVTGATVTVNSDVMTLYVGAPVAMSATAVTCTIFGGQQICQDTTHTAGVTALQSWAIQVVLSATAVATGQHQSSVQFKPN